jgi:acetyl-CoA acyltransferase
MSAQIVDALFERTGIDPAETDEVIWGCANQTGEQSFNIARFISLQTDIPHEAAALTVNRLCGSSLEAIISAARRIMLDEGDVYVCGGVEHMGHVPMTEGFDINPSYSLNCAMAGMHMGMTAEYLSMVHDVPREDQDRFALRSFELAREADFSDEIVPINGHDASGKPIKILKDYMGIHAANTTFETLSALKPAFVPGIGTVTAGNSSAISDGASALMVMSGSKAEKLGLEPIVRINSWGVAGIDPSIMGYAPVPATELALKRAGLNIDKIDVIELNEAFAAQSIPVLRDLGLEDSFEDKVNLKGGAIALGHPLGCSGARIATTLVHLLKANDAHRFGLATMCIGMGQGIAAVFEGI